MEPSAQIGFLFFFSFGRRISANTTGNFNYTSPAHTQPSALKYNLVSMEALDGLSSETIVPLFYKYKTTGYKLLLWNKAQSDYKDHKLKSVELTGLCQIIHVFI